MCDCKDRIEAKLIDRYQQTKPGARDHKVSLKGYGIVFGENCRYAPFMVYEETSIAPRKAGGERIVKTQGNLFFTFCPFCGERLTPAT